MSVVGLLIWGLGDSVEIFERIFLSFYHDCLPFFLQEEADGCNIFQLQAFFKLRSAKLLGALLRQ